MPRPQRELDPNGGALVAFARDLRALREQAGSPKFATMERKVGRSKSTLAEAAGGRHLPRWDTVADFVRACGADPAPWRPRWEQLRRELGAPVAEQPLPPASGPDEATPGAGEASAEDALLGVTDGTIEPGPAVTAPENAGVVRSLGAAASVEPDRAVGPVGAVPDRGSSRRWSNPSVLVVATIVAVLFCAAGVFIGRVTGPHVAGPYVRAIEVQNKVALGTNLLVEDRTPAYLSSSPIAYCAAQDRNCKVAGTEMGSGAGIVAHCTTHGQEMHNFNLDEAAAANNPDRSTSDLWYRATFPDGLSGFISEVYLSASSRGGLGLPDCGPGLPVPAASTR